MMENRSEPLVSPEQLNNALGYSLSEDEFQSCLQQAKFLQPKVGKFWQGTEVKAGIYIVIAGKVRLLDDADELIVTLEAGSSFGEFTLFPNTNFVPYAARASVNLQLCFIPESVLLPLIAKYPQIRENFWEKARSRNSLLSNSEETTVGQTNIIESQVDDVWSTAEPQLEAQKKISKAYLPQPTQRVGHLLQKVTHRYPYFAQQSSSDCGAACLVMVSRYWGKRFSVNRLRDIANVDRNGASLRGLAAAAESIGFNTKPVKASLDKLAQQELPAIIHWEGKHYIVVYEITRKHVIVADPGISQLTLTHEEFKAKWTNYVLLLQPTAFLKDAKESTTPFWQFFELMKPHSLVMFEVFVASLFIQIFGLITPLFTQLILDRVVVQRSELTLFAVGLGLLIFSLFRVAITGLR
ncbi:MAG: cysteine peptidase family C39 domain-containing protein, partial [Cyanobacteria bacterium P01_D01_bin.116]